jgi:orotate phosphoribosyltransferase
MAHHLNLEVVAGESAAGDAIAQAMMHVSTSLGDPLDACLVHREEIAPGLRIVGPAVSGRRVALVVGLRVTGPNVSRTIEILREAGAEVVAVIALVDNGTRMHLVAREAGLPYRGAIGLEQLGVADLA